MSVEMVADARTVKPWSASGIRESIIEIASQNGGHLASPLGVVEISMAVNRVFDTFVDRVIYDTGHQAYAHKILTDRHARFSSLRKRNGISGFPNVAESRHDALTVGHAGTAVSAAVGMCAARDEGNEWVVAVVGDGAIACGMTLEALNLVGSRARLAIVLNDNHHAISAVVGRLATQRKVSYRRLCEALGISYFGPVDGHEMSALESALLEGKQAGRPFLVHALTQKGRGLPAAESDPTRHHAAQTLPEKSSKRLDRTLKTWLAEEVFPRGGLLFEAGMLDAAGLGELTSSWPDNIVDLGIAESTVLTAAVGAHLCGHKAVVHMYSTFLQRATDQLIHDVVLNDAALTVVVDRAGLSGGDGPSHHGIYDLSIVSAVGNSEVLSVSRSDDYMRALRYAQSSPKTTFVRVSKGEDATLAGASLGEWSTVHREGSDGLILTHGRIVRNVLSATDILAEQGHKLTVIEVTRLEPLDEEVIALLKRTGSPIWTVDEHIYPGSLGSRVRWLDVDLTRLFPPSHCIHIKDPLVGQGVLQEQWEECGFAPQQLANRIGKELH